MLVSEKVFTWAMRFYPPLFFQGIWTKQFERGYLRAHVKICKSFLNLNYNRSIFGGSIFSAADPFHVILFHQNLRRRGYDVTLWLSKSSIDFIRPGHRSLYLDISIKQEDIEEACSRLDSEGKFIKTFPVKITNKEGELHALVQNEIYIRLKKAPIKISAS